MAARVVARKTARRSKAATRARSEAAIRARTDCKRERGNGSNKGSNRVWKIWLRKFGEGGRKR